MSKSICALRHRPGSDRTAFQHYYETSHAPLGVRHFPFTRYVRNHLLNAPGIGFDTISEFWADDIGATAALMDGPVGEILRADEEKFMDRQAISPSGADEHILSSGMPTDETGDRYATLIDRKDGEEDEVFRAAVLEWGRQMALGLDGVSVDFTQSWGMPTFPAAAVLWGPRKLYEMPAGMLGRTRLLRVRRCETPAIMLLGNARSE